MATSKKPTTSAAKHKAAAPKKVATKPPTAQAMDIIPKNRVRPTTTSRPVITTSTPAVADNTLTAPSGAPTLQIKRRQITINPSADSELSKDDVMPNLAAAPVEAVASSAQGVSVSDLIAKRKEKVVEPTDQPVAEAEAPVTADVAPEAETAAVPAETETPSEMPGTTPELPESEAEATVDDPAAAEAARLLSDAPETPAITEEPTASQPVETVTEESQSEPEPEPEPELKPEVPAEEPVAEAAPDVTPEPEQPAAEPKPAAPAETAAPDPKPQTGDTVEDIFKDEKPEQPQEHSQALKDEIKSMDEKGAPSHHSAYDGQPVIVVHKEHGPMSALAWVLWFFLCLALAVLVVNFLLDAGFIETNYRVPHTNIL